MNTKATFRGDREDDAVFAWHCMERGESGERE